MYKQDLILKTYNSWYAIKPNQTKFHIFNVYLQIGFGINNQQCPKTKPNQTYNENRLTCPQHEEMNVLINRYHLPSFT